MTDRPLITFALFAYNQEKFIEEAVLGVFYPFVFFILICLFLFYMAYLI